MSLEAIKKQLSSALFFQKILEAATVDKEVVIRSAPGSLPAALLALLFERTKKPFICLFPFIDQAERFKDELDELLPESTATLFPPPKVLPWGHHEAHATSQQLEVIERLLNDDDEPFIIVANVHAVQAPLRTPQMMRLQKLHFQKKAELPFSTVIEQLAAMDFERQPMIEIPGEMSVRGGIIDIYPFSRALPVRLEFWGDTIESIREFDPATQRSQRELQELFVYPQNIQLNGQAEAKKSTASLLDYFADDTIACFFQTEQMAIALGSSDGNSANGSDEEWLPSEEMAAVKSDALDAFLRCFNRFSRISFPTVQTIAAKTVIDCQVQPQPSFHGDLASLRHDMEKFVEQHAPADQGQAQLYFLCESPAHCERLKDLFEERDFNFSDLHVITANLHGGFQLPQFGLAVYTDHEFYGRVRRVRQRRRFRGSYFPPAQNADARGFCRARRSRHWRLSRPAKVDHRRL
jgi:transcription-repair coupling factor (superfamily II helicase)